MKQEDMPTSIQTTQIDMAVLLKLQEERDLALAENARLKAAMDKYSEDEMLCNDTIEQPAQGMVMVSKVELEDAWRQADAGNCLGLSADLRHILDREEKSLGWRDPRLMSDAELAQDWVKSKRSE